MAGRIRRRFWSRNFKRWMIPVILGFMLAFFYSTFMIAYKLHSPSSFGNDYFGNSFINKFLGINTANTSTENPLSLESLGKNHSVKTSPEENKDQMDPDSGHGTWIGEGLNDTSVMFKNRRQERRENRSNELMNNDNNQKFEESAIARLRNVDSAPLGNYTIWKNEYRRDKTFEDLLHLMKDQIIMARVYSGLAKMTNNLTLHQELETQLAKVTSEKECDIDQQQRVLDNIREMGQILAKAKEHLYECKLVTNKLRAMLQRAEEELESTQSYINFMTQIASKSLPSTIHCLTMRLNLEYHLLPLPMRNFPKRENLENPNLYHYALFSDNVLAASVVINSTVTNAEDSSKHVFHIVTDKLNFGAMTMWFLLNPPGEATIYVQRFEDFTWLNSSYSPVLRQLESASLKKFYFKTDISKTVESGSENLKYRYPKYISMLNHLRFYLPRIFPKLDKILFLDDDVVVQKDLTPLWSANLKGKVNGAVETCRATGFHRFDTYLNFSDQRISERFDPKACGWAYGMNIFDLKEWKKNNITETYHFWQNLNENRTLWKLGTLPPGLMTFYNLTLPIEKKWHLLGLGYDKGIKKKKIENAAVIHFNGHKKPWSEMGITKYQRYWTKYIDFDHPYVSSCRLYE